MEKPSCQASEEEVAILGWLTVIYGNCVLKQWKAPSIGILACIAGCWHPCIYQRTLADRCMSAFFVTEMLIIILDGFRGDTYHKIITLNVV